MSERGMERREFEPQSIEITVGRHYRTKYNELGMLQGQVDTDLNPDAIEEQLDAWRVDELPEPDILVGTGLKRTWQTIDAMVKRRNWHHIPVIHREDLNERALGVLEKKTHAEAKQMILDGEIEVTVPLERVATLTNLSEVLEAPDFAPPGGESMNQTGERFRNGLFALQKLYPQQHLLLINHYACLKSQGFEIARFNHAVVRPESSIPSSERIIRQS